MKVYIITEYRIEQYTRVTIYSGVIAVYINMELAIEHVTRLPGYNNHHMHEPIHYDIKEIDIHDELQTESIAAAHNNNIPMQPEPEFEEYEQYDEQ